VYYRVVQLQPAEQGSASHRRLAIYLMDGIKAPEKTEALLQGSYAKFFSVRKLKSRKSCYQIEKE